MIVSKFQITSAKFQRNSKRFGVLIIGIWLLFVIWNLGFGISAHAAPADNVQGFAYSPNFGWMSFNNTTDGSGVSYGVNINPEGHLSGYAWAGNGKTEGATPMAIGWFSFNRADTGAPPSADIGGSCSGCLARVNQADGSILGWARFIAAVPISTGWDGWVRFDHGAGNAVRIAAGEFRGFAWGGDSLGPGWISMNCLDGGSCGSSPYKVTTTFSFNTNPTVSSLNVATTNPCDATVGDTTFSWVYSDADGDAQAAYRVEVYNSSGALIFETDPVPGNGFLELSSTVLNTLLPTEGSPYTWKLTVKDSRGGQSATTSGPAFGFPWPNIAVDFTSNPVSPSPGTPTAFTSTAVCVNAACSTYAWVFIGGSPSGGVGVGPITTTFASAGTTSVTHTVTNTAGNSCSTIKNIGVAGAPKWRRFLPF